MRSDDAIDAVQPVGRVTNFGRPDCGRASQWTRCRGRPLFLAAVGLFALLLFLAVATRTIGGGDAAVPLTQRYGAPLPGGQPVRASVQSWKRLQQEHVVIQQRDYSCGAAALATLLQFYFGDPVTEAEILTRVLEPLDAEALADREANGLSLDDLFQAAQDLGYLAAVIRLPLEKLPDLPAPVLVRIEREDFKHFVVLRGSVEDRVYLADPIRGQVRMSAHRFASEWSGEALVLGKADFGLPTSHGLQIRQQPPVRNELQPVRWWLIRSGAGLPAPAWKPGSK